jgi:RNA polymerase sigma factor (sigma-70 family)
MLARPECKPLAREEEERLIAQAQRGNVKARNRVVMSHARLAADKILGFLRRYDIDAEPSLADDMLQATLFGSGEGGGIARAIGSFDPDKGTRFSALLQQWIYGEIDSAFAQIHQCGPARRTRVRRSRIREIADRLEAASGPVTVDEVLAEASQLEPGLTHTVVARALDNDDTMRHEELSKYTLDQPQEATQQGGANASGRHALRLPQQLIDHEGPAQIERAAEASLQRDRLRAALSKLPERDALIVCALHIDECKPAEVAAEFCLSTNQVRLIAKEALATLRAELEG